MNVTTNVNSSPIQFYIPNHLKNQFDEIISFRRLSRSYVLNDFIESWVTTQFQKIKDKEEISDLLENVKQRSEKKNTKTDVEESTNKWSVKSQNTWEDSY